MDDEEILPEGYTVIDGTITPHDGDEVDGRYGLYRGTDLESDDFEFLGNFHSMLDLCDYAHTHAGNLDVWMAFTKGFPEDGPVKVIAHPHMNPQAVAVMDAVFVRETKFRGEFMFEGQHLADTHSILLWLSPAAL